MAPAILSNSMMLANAEIVNGKSVNYTSDRFEQNEKSTAIDSSKLLKQKPRVC